MSDTQRTLVLLKPDAVRRGLVGEIVGRYENKGLAIEALELRRIDGDLADQHYAEHLEQAWYPPLREFVLSGPLLAAVLSGPQAIEVVRLLHGPTNALAAQPGTVRGDLATSPRENLVHASDSPDAAAREIPLWFPRLG